MVKGKNKNNQKVVPPKPSPVAVVAPTSQVIRRHSQKIDDVGPPVVSTTAPKHVPIPNIPRMPELAFEFFILLIAVTILSLNYLNLYKTFFWIPHSYTKYAMHFYLIDKWLLYFIVILLARRFFWSVLKYSVLYIVPHKYWKLSLTIARIAYVSLLFSGLGISLYSMTSSFNVVRVISLIYPFVFYICIYKLEIISFLESIPMPPCDDEKNQSKQNIIRSIYHTCSTSPDNVRSEVKFVKDDCNNRIALVIFQTIVCVHYTTIVPCLFAPNSLNYDYMWIKVQTFFVFMTFLAWHLVFCFPAKYCDILHRVALHLGSWSKIDSRTTHAPFNLWSHATLWPHGAYVKHAKELYRAEGITNAAEPGNSSHVRLYMLFAEPWRYQLSLLALNVLCSLLNLMFLATLHQWQQLLATGFVLAASYAALFVLLRDYLILRRVYQYESMQQGKATN